MTETETKKKIEYKLIQGDIFDRIDRVDHSKGLTETVAHYQFGVVEMLPTQTKYRTQTIRALQNDGHKYLYCGKMDMTGAKPVGEDPELPPAPKKSRIRGEKTHAYVEWMARYYPDRFKATFGIRQLEVRVKMEEKREVYMDDGQEKVRIIQVPVYRASENLNYDVEKLLTGEHKLIADRKTHLTEKATASSSLSDYDEDLDRAIEEEAERKRKGLS